jgi:hypothetical protein
MKDTVKKASALQRKQTRLPCLHNISIMSYPSLIEEEWPLALLDTLLGIISIGGTIPSSQARSVMAPRSKIHLSAAYSGLSIVLPVQYARTTKGGLKSKWMGKRGKTRNSRDIQ